MANRKDSLQGLLEALEFSPQNIPLRKHVASLLLEMGRYSEAETHFTDGLAHAPNDKEFKLGLALAFYGLGKHSPAFVITEELIEAGKTDAAAFMLHARLSSEAEEYETAIDSYKNAIALNPNLVDPVLEDRLAPHRNASHLSESDDEDDEYEDEDSDPYGRVPVEYPEDDFFTEIERPKINFSDVGGMDEVKEEISMKIIHPLQHPELYKAYGKSVGGGVLMYGPPGCGKTHLARATAGQVQASFLAVGINDILDMWIGNSEKNLHRIFELARSQAPCVLFFDEVDALGASRSDMRKSGGRHLINQFLSELDGAQYSNEGVLILAATNSPWNMDPAFRRPGRFDRILLVPPPDGPARDSILRILLKEKPIGSDINYEKLARKTKGLSGADLKAIVDIATEVKLRESMKTGDLLPIEHKDLAAAVAKVPASTKEWFATARNYALYSNESGLYDDILAYLNIKK